MIFLVSSKDKITHLFLTNSHEQHMHLTNYRWCHIWKELKYLKDTVVEEWWCGLVLQHRVVESCDGVEELKHGTNGVIEKIQQQHKTDLWFCWASKV